MLQTTAANEKAHNKLTLLPSELPLQTSKFSTKKEQLQEKSTFFTPA